MGEPVYILLPVHNRRAITVRMAEALRGQTRQDFQLVLVDDGSTDGTADAAIGGGRAACITPASGWRRRVCRVRP